MKTHRDGEGKGPSACANKSDRCHWASSCLFISLQFVSIVYFSFGNGNRNGMQYFFSLQSFHDMKYREGGQKKTVRRKTEDMRRKRE